MPVRSRCWHSRGDAAVVVKVVGRGPDRGSLGDRITDLCLPGADPMITSSSAGHMVARRDRPPVRVVSRKMEPSNGFGRRPCRCPRTNNASWTRSNVTARAGTRVRRGAGARAAAPGHPRRGVARRRDDPDADRCRHDAHRGAARRDHQHRGDARRRRRTRGLLGALIRTAVRRGRRADLRRVGR